MDRPLDALPEGAKLPGYVVGRVLGRGGFGITYAVADALYSAKTLAIKEFLPAGLAMRQAGTASVHPSSPDRAEPFRRALVGFEQEARTLVTLHHPNVVEALSFFEFNGTAYVVMKFEEGTSLAQYIANTGTLDEASILSFLPPLLDGLEAVHSRNFIHRDIKPDNIYLRRADGSPVLLDFGAARQFVGLEGNLSLSEIVTPGYAPLEQYDRHATQGPFTDLYALGATLYRCMTGRTPPEAITRYNARRHGKADPLVPVAELAPRRYSPSLVQAVERALLLDERARPQSVAVFRTLCGIDTAGRTVEGGTTIGGDDTTSRAGPPTGVEVAGDLGPVSTLQLKPSPRRPTLVAAIAAAVVFGAGAVLGVWIFLSPTPKPLDVFRDCRQCPEMVSLPGGTFRMGVSLLNEDGWISEIPQRPVTVRRHALGKYPITRGEFAVFARETGRALAGCFGYSRKTEKWDTHPEADWSQPGFNQSDDHPAVCVSWDDAKAYAAWLSRKSGKEYRLPSEAEWEYGARAGTTTAYFWGAEIGKNRAACDGCGSQWDMVQPAPVGAFPANPFGLHILTAGAREWVEDCWHDNYVGAPGDGDPWVADGDCARRVQRGGTWVLGPKNARAAQRSSDAKANRNGSVGFRLARSL